MYFKIVQKIIYFLIFLKKLYKNYKFKLYLEEILRFTWSKT